MFFLSRPHNIPSIVAGLFVLIVPTIQLTGRTLRVRDPY
jgi:ABC-type phosphate transport system permease subunit